ncbi:hypothetical protein [Vulcanisaeta sp. JCM 16161]|uniref:hypothetical protein n=1 Tax=Vulcanisaeta sp. JCM 16161 TaxID=1295372 RepID=UPI001FB38D19|nr:hypothetical protein [Vulcanisaeta sp. JCM 16161]
MRREITTAGLALVLIVVLANFMPMIAAALWASYAAAVVAVFIDYFMPYMLLLDGMAVMSGNQQLATALIILTAALILTGIGAA